jgi:DNA-binding NtrC family response regulator
MRVLTAADGNEALLWLERQTFDVALCDVKMPGIDGIELLRRLKRSQPMLEVILMTGHPEVGLAVHGIQEGAFDYLIKPQPPEALALKIQEAWQRRWQHEEQERRRRLTDMRERQPD